MAETSEVFKMVYCPKCERRLPDGIVCVDMENEGGCWMEQQQRAAPTEGEK